MTPEEAREALDARRPRPKNQADAVRLRAQALARSNARSRALTALARVHDDDYQALYDAALADEIRRRKLT